MVEPVTAQRPSDPGDLLRQRNNQFATLSRLSALISQSEKLEDALDATLDQLLALTEADIGAIHVLEPATGSLILLASHGITQGFACAEQRIPVSDCLCGEAARTGEVVESPDLTIEPRLSRSACRDERFGSLVSIPLKSRDRVVGLLTVFAKRPNCFSQMDHELLVLVSRQIGVAVENAQLYARTRELAVLEERGLIAQEIHDGIAQSLAYLNLEAARLKERLTPKRNKQLASELSHIQQVIKDTYEDVRELLIDFRSKFKEGEGLTEALERYLQEFSHRTGIYVKLTRPSGPLELTMIAQLQLFRVIQEALSNVRKHAEAKHVEVAMVTTPATVEVSVRDDGRGFDPQTASDQGPIHIGLEIMRERVAHLRGTLELASRPGHGTTLRVIIPLDPVHR